VLKILSRKKRNRIAILPETTECIVSHLSAPLSTRTTAEAANVMLNLCYEQQNVDLVVKQAGPAALIPLLKSQSQEVQANAAGALQSICYQKPGRVAVQGTEAVESLVALLTHTSPKVVMRAVGALHNISSDTTAIRIIRRCCSP
jgi:Armadillo/beta-catenin-like repeat